jgi:hypothetical protein
MKTWDTDSKAALLNNAKKKEILEPYFKSHVSELILVLVDKLSD